MPKKPPPRKDQNRVPRPPRASGEVSPPGAERVAKVIARAGLGSRREIEEWIGEGRVAVNGEVLASPARTVTPEDRITVDGTPLPERERTRLFLYHKPKGVVTTNYDPEGRPTLFEILPPGLPRLVSIGRLDLSTEGLILLTNDGGLARLLELPDTGWLRRYRVRAKGTITQDRLDTLIEGSTVEGVHYGPIEALLDRVQGANVWLTLALREGKNREVRNVLGALGLEVNRLIRLSYGPFQLGDLGEGAVEEVRTRVLADQLGPELTAAAGADFDGPLFDHAVDDDGEAAPPARRGRPERSGEKGRAADKAAGKTSSGKTSAGKTMKAGILTDRKGRKFLVQRVRSSEPEVPDDGPERAPLRPRREDRSERSVRSRAPREDRDSRPPRRERPEGDRPPRERAFRDRAPRDEAGGERSFRPRPPRSFDREEETPDRPPRSRGPREDRDSRPPGRERPEGDRPARERAFRDRPPRDAEGGERTFRPRPPRSFDREDGAPDRPPRSRGPRKDRDSRPPRRERPEGDRPPRERAFRDRPPRDVEGGERTFRPRPPRSFDREEGSADRPPRSRGPREDRDARPPRRERPEGDRPPRRERPEGDRPPRERAFRDRAPRDEAGGERSFRPRPPRSFDREEGAPDRPPRSRAPREDRDSRPPRRERPEGDRPPRRSSGERPYTGRVKSERGEGRGKSTGAGKPSGGKSFGGKPSGGPRSGAPRSGGPKGSGPRSGGPKGGGPKGGGPRGRPPRG